jgi:hypothetical protein
MTDVPREGRCHSATVTITETKIRMEPEEGSGASTPARTPEPRDGDAHLRAEGRAAGRQALAMLASLREGRGAHTPSGAAGADAASTGHRSAQGPLPAWWLRVGLGFVFAYAAVAALLSPEGFSAYFPGFLPTWAIQVALPCFAAYELGLAVAFVSGRHTHAASLAEVLTVVGIVVPGSRSPAPPFPPWGQRGRRPTRPRQKDGAPLTCRRPAYVDLTPSSSPLPHPASTCRRGKARCERAR